MAMDAEYEEARYDEGRPNYFLVEGDTYTPLEASDLRALIAQEFPFALANPLSAIIAASDSEVAAHLGERQYVPVPEHEVQVPREDYVFGCLRRREGEALWEFFEVYRFRHEREYIWAKLRWEEGR